MKNKQLLHLPSWKHFDKFEMNLMNIELQNKNKKCNQCFQ